MAKPTKITRKPKENLAHKVMRLLAEADVRNEIKSAKRRKG